MRRWWSRAGRCTPASAGPRILNIKRLFSDLVGVAFCAAFLLTLQRSEAQLPTLVATKLFATSQGNERNGLAYDAATERLYVADGLAQLRAYELDGTLVLGPLALPGNGQNDDLGLQLLREGTSIGGVPVAAGTLIFLRAGLGNDPQSLNEATLYALDKTTALATATEVLTADFFTPGNCRVLKDKAKGLGFSARRDTFLSVDVPCQVIGEIDSGVVTGFFDIPGGISGSSGEAASRCTR